jgi:hypothetical protein
MASILPRWLGQGEAARAAALGSQNTVAAVAEDWFAAKVRKERGGKDVERNFRTYCIAAWGDRQIHEITRINVLTLSLKADKSKRR